VEELELAQELADKIVEVCAAEAKIVQVELAEEKAKAEAEKKAAAEAAAAGLTVPLTDGEAPTTASPGETTVDAANEVAPASDEATLPDGEAAPEQTGEPVIPAS
jgi:hypothetical protein